MPRAEVGSIKYLNNKLKSKGLQRLRWYCQVCERQMRDENGFKMHVQSESHVRQMVVVGENAGKFIQDYSSQFQRDFLQLLRTSHGEKKVNANHFYQEYIANKEHVHMNATRWTTLTEFVKMLGREGVCRVEEGDRGLEVAWIDNSPEALRRQDAIRKKERQDRGDEEREQRLIREQVERARRDAMDQLDSVDAQPRTLERDGEERIKLNFGTKAATPAAAQSPEQAIVMGGKGHERNDEPMGREDCTKDESSANDTLLDNVRSGSPETTQPEKVEMIVPPLTRKPKNVFAAAKKNPLATKAATKPTPQRPMSEAERIMRDELERKAARDQKGPPRKRPKF